MNTYVENWRIHTTYVVICYHKKKSFTYIYKYVFISSADSTVYSVRINFTITKIKFSL